MNRNMKHLFFFTTLLVLLVGLTAISAADVSDNSTLTDTHVQASTTDSMDNADVVQTDHKKVQAAKTGVNKKTIKNNKKSLSRDSGEIDYYVSNSGRDTNDGTKDKPYKTINKALTQVKTNSTYNIYLAGGNYTGKGNTNLTVNGSYNINFIGDGMNKTVIDGEAKYIINPNPGYVWYSGDVWWPYIGSGNYGMTITAGNGRVSISNLTVSHMWCPGGSSINAYEHAPVDNYGNLVVDGVNFYYNTAGVGSAIRNNHDATLTVNNSLFEGNRKSSSTGNNGIIYNNGTSEIFNTLFDGNYARWGTVMNDHHLTIVNSTIKNSIGYDGGSTYKFGSGIAANSDHADFYNIGEISDVVTNIINCTFMNNEQNDVYTGDGVLYINGSIFNHSTGIFIAQDNVRLDKSVGIYNCIFNDSQSSNIFTSLSVKTGTTFAVYSNSNRNIIIENNIVNSSMGYGFYINGNSTIRNNTLNRNIYVKGDNNTITGNIINNSDIYSIELVNGVTGNKVYNNTIYSQVFTGNKAVTYTSGRRYNNTVTDNIPVTGISVNLTDDNYNTYFDNDGVLRTNIVENGSTITLTGDLINKNLTFANTKVAFDSMATIFNGSITIKDNSNVIVNNASIRNTDRNTYAVLIESDNNRLSNNNIQINTTKDTKTIIIRGNNNNLENNIINITSTADTTGIDLTGINNNLMNTSLRIMVNTDNKSTGIILNNTRGNYVESGLIYINSTGNTSGYKIINTTNAWISTGFIIYTPRDATGLESVDSGNNIIQSSGSIYNAVNARGIVLEGNKTRNTNNTYAGSTTIRAGNAINVLLVNASNTNISSMSEIISQTTTADTARSIITNNTENINIFYQKFIMLKPDNKEKHDMIAIEQINSRNTNITSVEMKNEVIGNITRNNDSSFIKLVNTNNTSILSNKDVSKTNITLNNIAVILENSNNNKINNISVYTKTNYAVTLNNSNNNTIAYNLLNGNDINGGNTAVQEVNSKNNIIENNTHNITVIITNDNYQHYFTNNTFIVKGVLTAEIGSDIYNKTMIFPNTITISNPRNYTIYNGTIILSNSTEKSSLNNLRFNVTKC